MRGHLHLLAGLLLVLSATCLHADDIGSKDDYVLSIAGHAREIPLRLTWPTAPGQYPLLVFCHGALGSNQGNKPLVDDWAAHGYVIIQPTFGDSATLLTPEERQSARNVPDLLASPHVTSQWAQRPRDVRTVLDHLDQLARDVPAFGARLDRTRIGVAGHSYGAHTSMMLAGLRFPSLPGVPEKSFRAPQVQAFVLISPMGPRLRRSGQMYQGLSAPILVITGDNDTSPVRGQEKLAGDWRRKVYDLMPAGDKYLLWVNDAWHNFGGISGPNQRWPGAGPENPAQVALVRDVARWMFDAYLKQDAAALARLQQGQLEPAQAALGTLQSR